MTRAPIDLYALLPAETRRQDLRRGGALRAVLDAVSEQANVLSRDVEGLYDDLFIETCSGWAVPYLGDLVGARPLHEVEGTRRADVAKTIRHRRRKGTLPALEEMARDVTGWEAHTVAFFETLQWTQNVNHERRAPAPPTSVPSPQSNARVGTLNLRDRKAMDLLDGPFDRASRTVDVRPGWRRQGRANIPNVGFFLWRLESHPLTGVFARKVETCGWSFSPLGRDAPLFTRPRPESDDAEQTDEIHVPGPIRPGAFADDPGAWYGRGKSFHIRRDGDEVPLHEIHPMDLSRWHLPPDGMVGVDVALGRISFGDGAAPGQELVVDHHYGFPARIGGGPYDRAECLEPEPTYVVSKEAPPPVPPGGPPRPPWFSTLAGAIARWESDGCRRAVIEIRDNATYAETLTLPPTTGRWASELVIQAENRKRPHLRPLAPISVRGGDAAAALVLSGLLIEGGIHVAGPLGRLDVDHCTLVPGGAVHPDGAPADPAAVSIDATSAAPRLRVGLTASVTGRLRVSDAAESVCLLDSIVDGVGGAALHAGPGASAPSLTAQRSTLHGSVRVRDVYASDSLFTAPLHADRTQEGCIRFSHVPEAGRLPRRYRCRPAESLRGVTDPARVAFLEARLAPTFTSVRYGHPAYMQLGPRIAPELATGAEDGSEMGAYSHLKQPQREANLRMRLEEYLPFGLAPTIVHVT